MMNGPRLRLAITTFCLSLLASHAALFWVVRRQVLAGSPDFRIFYTAGRMLKRGQGQLLYHGDVQLRTQQEFAAAVVRQDGPLPYNHPPFEAVLYVGMAYFSYIRAYFLWFMVNLVLVALTIHVILPWLPTVQAIFPRLVYVVPLAFFPVAYALMQGQDSVLLLLLYTLAYAAFRRRQDLRAGVYLGLGLFKFHLVFPFVFILLLKRRWRACGGVVLAACFDLALSLAITGWRELLYYPRYVWRINQLQPARVIVPQNMPNLRGLLSGWAHVNPGSYAMDLALLLVSLAALVWASRQWKSWDVPDFPSWNTGFCVAMVATFLVGYHGYNQDMSTLLLPALITLDRVLRQELPGFGVKTALGLMFFTPLYLVLTLHFGHQNLFALVLLMFAGFLAASSASARSPTWADKSKVPSSVQLG